MRSLPISSNGNRSTPSSSKGATSSGPLPTDERVRKRYFEELKAIDCVSSEDENYPEGAPAPLTKKQRRNLCTIQGSLSCDIKPVQSTLTHNIYNRPVVVENVNRTERINAEEDLAVAKGSQAEQKEPNHKIPAEGPAVSGKKVGGESRRTGATGVEEFKPVMDVLSRVYGSRNPYDVNEESFKAMVSKHRALKLEGKSEVELLPGDTCLEDIGQRVRMCSLNKRLPPPRMPEIPKKTPARVVASASSSSDEMDSLQPLPKKARVKRSTPLKPPRSKSAKARAADQQPGASAPSTETPELATPPASVPATSGETTTAVKTESSPNVHDERSRALGPPFADIKPDLKAPPPPSPPPPPPPSLTEDTHLSFFHLIRQILLNNGGPSSTLKQVVDAVLLWNSSPISPLNEW